MSALQTSLLLTKTYILYKNSILSIPYSLISFCSISFAGLGPHKNLTQLLYKIYQVMKSEYIYD